MDSDSAAGSSCADANIPASKPAGTVKRPTSRHASADPSGAAIRGLLTSWRSAFGGNPVIALSYWVRPRECYATNRNPATSK